jgi:hypothetical protein
LTSGASQSDWSITGRNTGTLSQTGTVITFAGFAHLQGLQANTFDIQASGSLGVGSSAGSVQGSLNNSVLKFNENGAYTWTLNGAGEGNVARGGSTLINFSGMTALQGADGRDDFVLKDQKASIGSIDGGGGINSLSTKWNGREPLMWAVVNNEGKLNDHVSSFNNISELIGQSGVDQFHISGSTKLNFIDSGDGNDEIYLSGDSKVDLILAGAGADIIAIAENAFVGNPDISERTSIDGGEGNDTLDLTGLNRKVLWDIANQKIGDFAYLSIEKLKAPNDPANAIQAPNTNNTWTITGINSGELNAGNGVIVSYEGIANLIGGNLRDDFILDSPDAVIGKVDGGLGVNKLQGGDADYRWFLTGENSGYLEKASEKIADFENIQNLTGGSGADRFEVAENGNLSGWLAGGADDDQIIFSNGQNISVWLADGTGTGPKEGQWWLLRTDIENISAQITEGLNHLQLESKTPRSWTISALNQGKVGDVNFSGFGQLTGGAGDDTFTLEENGSLSGLLDGGLGNNAVDLREWSRSVTVALGERVGADLQVTNIYEINANNSFSNTLWARDEENTWTIDGVNAGRLKAKTRLVFSGFSNLRGGEEKDVFELSAEGMVHGSIDGGSNENKEVVDEVAYIGQKEEFVVNLNGDNRLYNIEHLKGNRYLILQGPDFEAEWEIDGLDRGKLSYGVDQNLSFDSVQRILGGSNVDKFSFKNGGAITNGVDGGDGDDQFFIDLAIGESNLLTKLDGGGGNDFLQFTGGGKGWEAVYRQSADKESWFDFNIPSESAGSTSVRYSGIDKEVVLQANLDKVVLKGEDGDDQFFFGDGFWTLNNLTSVHFKDFAKSIEVLADKGSDEIIFNNIVRIPNKLTLIGGKVKSDVPAIIEAKDLEMRFVKGAGTREAPLDIFVENLRVVDNSAPIYLRELNGVNLLGLQTDGIFDLVVLNGDVTQKDEVAGIEGAGNFTFWVEEGELKLESSKNFVTGSVGLFAKKAARFSNATATTLLESRAADLAVDSVGDISSESALRVSGETRLITSGNIVLKNEKNDFSRVSLVADGFVDLANNMDGSPEGRTLDLTGGDIDGDLNVQTGNKGILISGRVSSKGDVSFVTAGGIRSKGEVNSYIEAQKFIARTDSGIGSEDRDLNLQVGIIDAINNGTSPILLANKGMLTVERIHSAGDIYLKNSESVKFLKNSVSAFYLGENEPLYPPGDKAQKENPSYGGNFQLTLEKGYILTDLSVDRYEPHIAARNAEILNYHGAFGAVPPVIYVPGRLFILSGLSRQPPIQGFDVKPHPYEDDTIYTGVFGAGEQIIEVENLAEIDPAIFTQVKNYFYQDISIRLSSDQLFEDEE